MTGKNTDSSRDWSVKEIERLRLEAKEHAAAGRILLARGGSARVPERHGELFRVLCRGALNSCLVESQLVPRRVLV